MTEQFNYLPARLIVSDTTGEDPNLAEALDFNFDATSNEVYIGRAPGNHIQLNNGAVSGQHVRLLRSGGEYFLHELESRNGTSVNGERVASGSRKLLRDGDLLQVVHYNIEFHANLLAGLHNQTTDNTTQFALSMLQSGVGGTSGVEETPPQIFVTNGEEQGLHAPLPTSYSEIRIGRSRSCQLPINDENISREHCLVRRDGNRVYIRDLNSRNGVMLNGKRLPPNADMPLRDRDEFMLGTIAFVLSSPQTADEDAAERETERRAAEAAKEEHVPIQRPSMPLPSELSEEPAPEEPENMMDDGPSMESDSSSPEENNEDSDAEDELTGEESERPPMQMNSGLTPVQKLTIAAVVVILLTIVILLILALLS
jgi:pSer/pThr/pTyr-binding forkhead associated (FHA) protein